MSEKNERVELVERIMNDIYENFYNYQSFIMDTVSEQVKTWDTDSMKDFLGIEEDE